MSPSNAAGAAQVRIIVDNSKELAHPDVWPEPDRRLITDDLPSASSLNEDALPAGWEAWINAEAEARAGPRDYVAAGLIGAASAWIGNSRRIAATEDWNEPAQLWFAEIGAPSTSKTPTLRPMIEATRLLEREAEPEWRKALSTHERDSEVAKTVDKEWRESVREAAKSGVATPERPASAQEPACPPRPRLVTMDSSTEEIQRLLAENPRGLLHVRDELAGWLGAFDRYGGNGADRAFYLECWNGGAYVCDRVRYHGAPVRIEHAALSIIGGMVPDRVREVLADADDGLVERFIYVWPDPAPIAPLSKYSATEVAERRFALHAAARRLRALEMGTDDHGQPAPRALRLDVKAFGSFDEERQEAMRRARAASGLIAGWHGKNPGRILRLALLFELLAWAAREHGVPEPTHVSADAMARAVRYIEYAAAMLERVVGGLAISRADIDAAQIARHVLAIARAAPQQARLKRLNERSLYQRRGFTWARDKKRRGEALTVLCEAGWVRASQPDGQGRPRGDWQLNPRIKEVVP
jgi:Protein of unknown function (DUF3987)